MMIAMLLMAAVMSGRTAPPVISPPQTREDVTCSVYGGVLEAKIYFDDQGVPRTGRSFTLITNAVAQSPCLLQSSGLEITEVTDQDGKSLMGQRFSRSSEYPSRREELVMFMRSHVNDRKEVSCTGTSRVELTGFPAKLGVCRATFNVLVSDPITRRQVPFAVTTDPVEVGRATTFLMTGVEEKDRTTSVSFEVHTRRRTPGEAKDQLEDPLFLGLVLRNARGDVTEVVSPSKEVTTRDERLVVVTRAFVRSGGEPYTSAEVLLVDHIHRLSFELFAKSISFDPIAPQVVQPGT